MQVVCRCINGQRTADIYEEEATAGQPDTGQQSTGQPNTGQKADTGQKTAKGQPDRGTPEGTDWGKEGKPRGWRYV